MNTNENILELLNELNYSYGAGTIHGANFVYRTVFIKLQYGTLQRKFRIENGYLHFLGHKRKIRIDFIQMGKRHMKKKLGRPAKKNCDKQRVVSGSVSPKAYKIVEEKMKTTGKGRSEVLDAIILGE